MNVYETMDFLKTGLETGIKVSTDLLYGVNILLDPYDPNLTKEVPFVLIEADNTTFTNAMLGQPTEQEHSLSFTCVVTAQNEKFISFKSDVNNLVKNTINKLITIKDDRIHRAMPTGLTHSEIILGSLKTSAVIISVKVKTYWEDQ